MTERALARKYATALFDVAESRGEQDRVAEDLESLEALFEEDPTMRNFLEAPQVLDEHKASLVRTALEGRVSKSLLHFVLLLLEKDRIEYLMAIGEEYARMLDASRGILKTRVVTALPLEDGESKRLRQRLEKKTGKTIELVPEVDPAVIGGVIVFLEDKILDGSIRFQLQVLREELLAARPA
jgi:F-type H+-transporting ATPase subunit delta